MLEHADREVDEEEDDEEELDSQTEEEEEEEDEDGYVVYRAQKVPYNPLGMGLL